jgi:hypothetical protein
LGKIEFIGIDEEVLDIHALREFPGWGVFPLWINGRSRRHGNNPPSVQGLPSHLEEESAVDSPGKGNKEGIHFPDDLP